jgi:hypothetical protein
MVEKNKNNKESQTGNEYQILTSLGQMQKLAQTYHKQI